MVEFIGNGVDLSASWLEILKELLNGKSFNEIERELMLLRRQAVVEGRSMGDLLPGVVRHHVEQINKAARKAIATKLAAAGMPQRQLTISRESVGIRSESRFRQVMTITHL